MMGMSSRSDFDVLLSLPSEITHSILLSWLDLRSLAAADSAFCSKAKRASLLMAFNSTHYILPGITEHMSKTSRFLRWLNDRNVRVEKLFVTGGVDECLVEYSKKFGHHVRRIALNTIDFAQYNTNIDNFSQVLHYCRNLDTLVVENSYVNKSVLQKIVTRPTLRNLHVKGFNTTDDQTDSIEIPELQNTFHFETLELSCHASTAKALLQIASPSSLRCLQVSWYDHSVALELHHKLEQCKSIQALSIHADDDVFTDSHAIAMIDVCPHIHHLDMYVELLTPDCTPALARSLTQLKSLHVSVAEFTDAILMQIAEHRKDSIEALYIDECEFQGERLNEVLRECHKLRTLRFSPPKKISLDVSLLCNLTTLLVDCDRSATVFLRSIAPHCLKLETLGVVAVELHETDFTLLGDTAFPALRRLDLYCLDFKYRDTGIVLTTLHAQRPKLNIRWNYDLMAYNFLDVAQGIIY